MDYQYRTINKQRVKEKAVHVGGQKQISLGERMRIDGRENSREDGTYSDHNQKEQLLCVLIMPISKPPGAHSSRFGLRSPSPSPGTYKSRDRLWQTGEPLGLGKRERGCCLEKHTTKSGSEGGLDEGEGWWTIQGDLLGTQTQSPGMFHVGHSAPSFNTCTVSGRQHYASPSWLEEALLV